VRTGLYNVCIIDLYMYVSMMRGMRSERGTRLGAASPSAFHVCRLGSSRAGRRAAEEGAGLARQFTSLKYALPTPCLSTPMPATPMPVHHHTAHPHAWSQPQTIPAPPPHAPLPRYGQAGTPQLMVSTSYDAAKQTFTLTTRQRTPPTQGQPNKVPVLIPLKVRRARAGPSYRLSSPVQSSPV
jgi:hypothetical protein